MIYDNFRVTGAHDTFSNMLIYFLSLFVTTMFRISIRDGTKYIMNDKDASDDILESLYKLRIRESDQLETLLELYDMEIHQNIYRCPLIKN